MPFMGEHRVNWVMTQYRAYRWRDTIGWVLLLLSLALILSIGSLALQYYLPQTEDRLLCFLKPAVDSLRAYESYGKSGDKKKALKNLRKVASVLEEWTSGNLDFIKNGSVGKMLSDLQRNFRGGLLVALKDADKTQVRRILGILTAMEGVLEQTNSIDNEHLDIWSKMLSEYPLTQTKPVKPVWRRIPAKRSHLSIISMLVVIPTLTGWVGFALLHVPIEAAYLGGITMFGAMVGLLVFLISRKKPS